MARHHPLGSVVLGILAVGGWSGPSLAGAAGVGASTVGRVIGNGLLAASAPSVSINEQGGEPCSCLPVSFGCIHYASWEETWGYYDYPPVITDIPLTWRVVAALWCPQGQPCGAAPPAQQVPLAITWVEEQTYEVTGSASLQLKISLAERLVEITPLNFTVGQSLSQRRSVSQSTTELIDKTPCWERAVRGVLTKVTRTSVYAALGRHCYYWCAFEGPPSGLSSYVECEGLPISISASGTSTRIDSIRFQEAPKYCPYTAIPAGDLYDGRRAQPCCQPLLPPGCTPPGGATLPQPCCYCIAETRE